jgi:subtilase family serine protease
MRWGSVIRSTVALWVSLCPLFAVSQGSNANPLIVQTINEANLVTLSGNVHPLARPQFDQGPAPASMPLHRMMLVLKRSSSQESALIKTLDDQQDKSSAMYHRWMTPDEFGQQFGPSDYDLQTITTWLQVHGFQVSRVSKGRTIVEFDGTAGDVQSTFHTAIHSYLVNGEQHWANANDP